MVPAIGPDLAMRSRSPIARGHYIELAERAARAPGFDAEPLSVLEKGVAWLELFFLSSLTWEYIHHNGIHSMEQLRVRIPELDRHILATFHDVNAATQGIRSMLGELPRSDENVDWPALDWMQIVRSFDAIVAECPIEHLEEIGRRVDRPELAHRARVAYDALRAFVRRYDPERATVMRIVGEQYQRGNIRLRDAARLLGMSTSDAVFELEQDGFHRSPAAITLDEADREAAYQRLHERRRQRGETPVVDRELVERDVIASERIEGVDARVWIRRR